MFVPGKPLQPNLMFAGTAMSWLYNGAPKGFFSQVNSGLTRKHSTRQELLIREKHSSLLQTVVYYDRKKFYNIGHRYQLYKTFFSLLILMQNTFFQASLTFFGLPEWNTLSHSPFPAIIRLTWIKLARDKHISLFCLIFWDKEIVA